MICADDPFHVRLASEVATDLGVEIPMVVDINVGMDRTGVAPGRPALELARAIDRAPGLRLAGIMGYEGHVLTAWPNEEKRAGTVAAVAGLIESRRLIEADGMTVGIVSGGGSGNYMFAASLDGLTELQAGGACLMDPFYGKLCHLEELGFEYALTILTTVTSRPTPERVITDAGFKTLSAARGRPPADPGRATRTVELDYLSAEHGVWRRPRRRRGRSVIGDRLEIIPDYHDTTTFRHDAVRRPAWRRGRGGDPAPRPRKAEPEPMDFDLLIRGGTVVDGTGSPAVAADVGVRGDRIVAVGTLPDAGRRRGGRCHRSHRLPRVHRRPRPLRDRPPRQRRHLGFGRCRASRPT